MHVGRGGLGLTLECYGDESAPAVLYTHGFGQNRQAWHAAAIRLAEMGWPGIALDGRGHGDSEWATDGCYELDHFAEDLRSIVSTLPRKPVLIGASMGGLLGLLCEGEHGGQFAAMVLVDVTPRWELSGVDRILNFMGAHPDGFADFAHAAEAIAAYLPHRRGRKSPEQLRSLLVARADGRLRWHWDPRLLNEIARGSERYQDDLVAAAGRVQVPTLLISGGLSDLVSSRNVDEFLQLVPHATHVQIADATHMVAGDRNDQFTATILAFLSTLAAAEASTGASS